MGLDMYLTAKRYVSDYQEQDKAISTEMMRHFPELNGNETISNIDVRIGYWRKANAIHRWFVNHVQQGTDDCGNYYVSREKLQELRDTCERVLAFRELATAQLPPAEGFFFGDTEINEWYYRDLENTIRVLDRAMELADSGRWDIEYHSSW